ncbi:carbohydrate ABC transporter permease [Breznakiella homolactica]|uniref:Sugar ABC transporter permease n=1 Tax=Breznakiella homolactica TaxID=2798577 RepID=A0A7T7XPT5_9SPIR|nr:sugar ABC transporter permease [Breznakiella homolactica]QQO10162.1 sugar ABC transporter permease [Breznakiella homolactica]
MANRNISAGTVLPANRKRQILSNKELTGYIFIFPTVAILALLVVYPLLYGFYISFFKTNLIQRWDFVGLKYYIEAFTSSDFMQQLGTTVRFTFWVVLGHFSIGMILAVLLNRQFKGRTLFRIILLLPWLFPESVIALLFKWIFNPLYGIFTHFMEFIGVIDGPTSWLGTSGTAFPLVAAVCIWKGYPMIMLMILAGLQAIPADLYDAAKIDGASRSATFFKIVIPSLRPVLMVTLVLDTIWWFKHYTLVWVLTGGGPGNDTSIVSIAIYKEAFDNFEFGRAAAMSVIVFFICYILGYLYRRILDRE